MKATWDNARDGDTIGKEQTKHTPVPWRIHNRKPVYGSEANPPLVEIQNQDPLDPRCVVWSTSENAEFICRAVNAHADLLEACKMALEFVISIHGSTNDGDIQEQIRQAIQKAEGVL